MATDCLVKGRLAGVGAGYRVGADLKYTYRDDGQVRQTPYMTVGETISEEGGAFSRSFNWDAVIAGPPGAVNVLGTAVKVSIYEPGAGAPCAVRIKGAGEGSAQVDFGIIDVLPGLTISWTDPAESDRFDSLHWLHFRSADGKEVVSVSGNVRIELQGSGGAWKQQRVYLVVPFPGILPPNKAYQVEHWLTHITPSVISNNKEAIWAGWGVESFGGPISSRITAANMTMTLFADVSVRDTDGYVLKLAYQSTLVGTFVAA